MAKGDTMTRNHASNRHRSAIAALLVVAVALQGCSETIPRSVSYTLADAKDRLESPEGERVLGYERPDGSRVELDGRAYAAGDSIRFAYQRFARKAGVGGTLWTRATDADTMVARSEIETLLAWRKTVKQSGTVAGYILAGLAVAALVALSSWNPQFVPSSP